MILNTVIVPTILIDGAKSRLVSSSYHQDNLGPIWWIWERLSEVHKSGLNCLISVCIVLFLRSLQLKGDNDTNP